MYWQPVMGSGERIMVGVIIESSGETTAHRLIRSDVLESLYGSNVKQIEHFLDTALSTLCEIAKLSGQKHMPEIMGIFPGKTQTSQAQSRTEAIRHAIMLYSSLCNPYYSEQDEEEESILVTVANKRFSTDIRSKVIQSHPILKEFFNKRSPMHENGNPVRFGFISPQIILHFAVLHPTRQSQSVSNARAKLWELSGARDYIQSTAAMILSVPEPNDPTIEPSQQEAALRNRAEIEKEADDRKMRIYHVHSPQAGAEQLIELAA